MNAGYGTRLYPLTLNFPKGLLQVGKKTICDHILSRIREIGIQEVYLVTNSRFYPKFKEWGENKGVKVFDDGTDSPDNRLGAIRDIEWVLERVPLDDYLVLAGDNLFTFSLKGLKEEFEKRGRECFIAGVLRIPDKERIKQYGVVKTDGEGKILEFKEKPSRPFSDLASIGIYLFPGKKTSLVKRYLEEGNNPDAPGYFLEWLIKKEPVYAYIFEGKWYDIGTFETLEEARKVFSEGG